MDVLSAPIEELDAGEEIKITPDNLDSLADVFFPVKVSDDETVYAAVNEPAFSTATGNSHNSDNKGEDTAKTPASLRQANNREFSIDIIDAQKGESLAESEIASPTEPLSGTNNGDSTAATVAKTSPTEMALKEATTPAAITESTKGSQLEPAHCFVRGAKVGVLNHSRQKCDKYGKMVSNTGSKIVVRLFNGTSRLFDLAQLCILEMPQPTQKKSQTKADNRGFG